MPSLHLSDRLIWFAHCPKAGGTTIEQFMVSRWGEAVGHLHWGWDLWWKGGGWRLADPPNSPQHLVWKDAQAALPRHPDLVFAVVRDPVARMASEHRWQRHLRRGTRLGKALAYLPFSCWLPLMLALVERHPHAFDNHFRAQAEFIPEDARVFRLEDGLTPVLTWLAKTTGTGPAPEAARKNATRKSVSVSPRAAARIRRAFARDYARFGYDPGPGPTPARTLGDWIAARIAPGLAWLDRRGCL